MNTQIKRLLEQSGLQPYYNGQEVDIAKFAELLIEECANAIIKDSRLSDVRSAANGCVRTIKEHFGVE